MKDLQKPIHPLWKGTLRLVAFGAAFAVILVSQQLPGQDQVPAQEANPPQSTDPVPPAPVAEPVEAPMADVPPAPEKPEPIESETVDLETDDGSTTTVVNGEWSIRITPRATTQGQKMAAENEMATNYNAIYESIPYRRAEYLANPSYRHDTAVEILFGEMRNTVVHRTDSPQRVQNPRPQIFRPDAFPHIGDYRKFYWRQGLYSLRYLPSPIYPIIR